MTTLNLQVGASADDCYRRLAPDSFDLASALYNGDNTSSYYDYSSGMRFESVTIPQGDTINEAVLQFRAAALSGSIPLTKIDGEDADDAAAFSTIANYDGRGRTATSVDWTPGAWVTGTWYTSSEIKGVIQDIIDRGTWSSGNALAVFWNHDADGWGGSQKRLEAWSYNDGTASAPKLDIDYTAGGGGVTVTPPTATLTTATFSPVIKLVVIPAKRTLSLATFTPVLGLSVIPPPLALSLTVFAPTVTTTANVVVIPGVIALSLTAFAPTVTTTANVVVIPGVIALSLTAFAPTVTTTGDVVVTPSILALSLATFVPIIKLVITPPTLALNLQTFAPTISTPRLVTPSTATLSLAAFAPTVSAPRLVTPGVASLSISVFAPTVTVTGDMIVTPGVLTLSLGLFAPTVFTPCIVTPGVVALSLAFFVPTITVAPVFTAVWLDDGTITLLLVQDGSVSLPGAVNAGTISIKETEDATI